MRQSCFYDKVLDVRFLFFLGEIVLIRFLSLTVVGLLIGFCGLVSNAYAQPWSANTPASCDNDFADVMEARATMEAAREVEIAQTLILKPDSVLEYSCFHELIDDLDRVDNEMFTGNVGTSSPLFENPVQEYTPGGNYPEFLPEILAGGLVRAPNFNADAGVVRGPHPPGGGYSSATGGNILGILVAYSLYDFVYTNFGHTFAGGTYSGPLSSTCDPMNYVWEFVKCNNFNANLFLTFVQMEPFDQRVNPVACNVSGRAAFWNASLAAANPAPGATGGVIAVVPNTDLLGDTCASVRPIPTGLRVYRGGPLTDVFYDAVCPAPGCYYNGYADRCE